MAKLRETKDVVLAILIL